VHEREKKDCVEMCVCEREREFERKRESVREKKMYERDKER